MIKYLKNYFSLILIILIKSSYKNKRSTIQYDINSSNIFPFLNLPLIVLFWISSTIWLWTYNQRPKKYINTNVKNLAEEMRFYKDYIIVSFLQYVTHFLVNYVRRKLSRWLKKYFIFIILISLMHLIKLIDKVITNFIINLIFKSVYIYYIVSFIFISYNFSNFIFLLKKN